MDCGKCTSPRVTYQNRDTIGGLDGSQNVRGTTDYRIAINTVALSIVGRLRVLGVYYHPHINAMHLPAACQGPVTIEKLEKPAAILQNVLGSVFVKTGEVEGILRHLAYAAAARGESVREAILFQWRANQSLHAIALAPIKTGVLQF